MALLRMMIEFHQEDHAGKPIQLKVTVEQDLSEQEIESLDTCEKKIMEACYAAMREGMKAQMSYVSKKKALQQQRNQKKA